MSLTRWKNYTSKDVTFNESKFPYPILFPAQSSPPTKFTTYPAIIPTFHSSEIPTSPTNDTHQPTELPQQTNPSNPPPSPLTTTPSAAHPNPDTTTTTTTTLPNSPSPCLNTRPMLTRGKTGHLKPKTYLAHTETSYVKQALTNPDWVKAMQTEYDALLANHTWFHVPLPPHKKAIGCKWIYRVKNNPDGSLNKLKARLVVKGFHPTPGFDF